MSDPTTYPPDRHLLRSLHYEVEHRPDLTSTARLPVRAHLRSAHGTVEPGALATLVDATGGGLAALAAHPGWIATADLTLHLLGPVRADEVLAHGRVVRRGRTTVVIGVDLVDGPGRTVGTATMSFAVLERRDGNPVMELPAEAVRHRFEPIGSDAPSVPLLEEIGLRTDDPTRAVTRAPMTPFVVNTLGAMQGGAVATLVAGAAAIAGAGTLGTACECVDLELNYLALGRVGPIAAEATVVRTGAGWALTEIAVRDEGNADRPMTLARAVVVRP
ncbi:MAG: hotdog fold thioesterase [Actinomycetes bacterium]